MRIQRSAELAQQKSSEVRQLENNLSQAERSLKEQTYQLEQERNQLEKEKSQRELIESRFMAVTAATQKEFTHYEQSIISYTKEQERLTAQLKHTENENDNLKSRLTALEKEEDRWNDLAY